MFNLGFQFADEQLTKTPQRVRVIETHCYVTQHLIYTSVTDFVCPVCGNEIIRTRVLCKNEVNMPSLYIRLEQMKVIS